MIVIMHILISNLINLYAQLSLLRWHEAYNQLEISDLHMQHAD